MNKIFLAYLLCVLASCSITKSSIGQNKLLLSTELKVMSYNIHIASPPSKPGLTDMDAIINAIKKEDPDLIALQEVDVNTARSGKMNQAEIIATRLGMNYFFAKAIDHDGGEYGICILSKFPISEPKIHRLTTIAGTGGEPRVLATAKIRLNNGKYLLFANTHLDAQGNPKNREAQIADIEQITAKEELPFIIAGDFNSAPGSGVINKLNKIFTNSCQACEPTFPVVNPKRTIDFIAFRTDANFNIISHKVVQEHYASDHLPVMVVLQSIF